VRWLSSTWIFSVIFSANWGLVLVISLSKMSIASPLPYTVRRESQNVLIP